MKPYSNRLEDPASRDKGGVDSPAVEVSSISKAEPVATSTPGRSSRRSAAEIVARIIASPIASLPSPSPASTPPRACVSAPARLAEAGSSPAPPVAPAPRTPVAANISLAGRVPRTFSQIKGRRPVHSSSSPRTVKTGNGATHPEALEGPPRTPRTPKTPKSKRNPKKNKTPKTTKNPKSPKSPKTPKNPINTINTINIKSTMTSNSPQNPMTADYQEEQPVPEAEPGNISRALKRQSPPGELEEQPCTSSQAAKLMKPRDNTEGFAAPAKRSDFKVFQLNMRNRAIGLVILNVDQVAEQREPDEEMAAHRGQGNNLDSMTLTEQMPSNTEQTNAQESPTAENRDSATNTTDSRSPEAEEPPKTKKSCSIM